ncbi:hypothetical protein GRJ2_002872700 [Grus japonensis]|uniref:Core shell protein Gag P30 domain-containing protein n=1 Tax=Grus japonensis TaxID=30415 RepID=A0ABC9Y2B1_GRUJA
MVKVPFSITDLRAWKETAGTYQDDPERVAKVVETIIRTQNPDWEDLQVILDTLLEDTEKKMVLNMARKQVEGAHANGIIQGTVDQNFPSTNPEWDPNQPGPRGMLTRSQKWILFGDRHAMRKAIHRSKLYEVRQEFMERLKVTARKYTNLDPEKPEEAIQLASIFMGQSAPDIRKKLQKLEGAESRDLGKMLEVAWTVYNKREKEKEVRQMRRDGKILAILTENNKRGNTWPLECWRNGWDPGSNRWSTSPNNLTTENPTEKLEHDCLLTIEQVYSSRPDLKDEPLKDPDLELFTDGSSFVQEGRRIAGYAVVTTDKERLLKCLEDILC